MAQFVLGAEIATNDPTIEVTVDPTKPLPVGRQTFQLVVMDDSGNKSQPDRIVVIIADQSAPTAVLTGPQVVGSGRSFTLRGDRSFDVGGGKVVQWVWTYVGPVVT
jgi:hypothetical protein